MRKGVSWHYTYITWLPERHTKIPAPWWHESPSALCHPMPKTEGDITRQGFRVTKGRIFWYSRQRIHLIYVMWHFQIKTVNKWNTLYFDSSFRLKIPLLYLLCYATASLDLKPDLISMQKIYTTQWYNCLLCDITVSGGWYNCFRLD